jgi:ABC-2 type transport system permease protein
LTLHATATPAEYSINTGLMRRLWAVMLRHVYLYMGSWPRFVEMFYWPLISILTYGFISLSLVHKISDAAITTGVFISGVLLAEILSRTTASILLLFMEEIWSRNLGHLFASPILLREYIFSILCIGAIRSVLSVALASVVAYALFSFSILQLGWPLVLFILLLVMNSWWYGMLILALILRYGLAAEWLGWMIAFSLLPFVAAYYPVSVMPQALQWISWSLPATYVFESMKSLIAGQGLHSENLLTALVLNCGYFCAAAFILWRAYQGARRRGGLIQMGE